MKRFFILAALLTALAGCQSVDSHVTDPSAEAYGRETFKAIEFTIRDTSATKAPTPITSLSEFNVSATSGSAGSETSKLSNVVFSSSNGVFKSDAVWPSSDPGYHFYASNVAMTHTASGQTVSISTIDKDVVCAYLASPNYKVKNDLTFNHILARVGTVSFTNLSLCSNVKLSMKYSGSGTYNLRTGAWSSVGSQSTKELTTSDNDFWIIPGTYDATLTYNDANGTPQSKTLNQDFLAGKVNNISAKLDGSVVVKTEDEYEAPTFTLGTISDVPAGGGDSGTPSVTAVGQRKRVKKTLADGTVKYDPDWMAVSSPNYTIQYGKTLASLSDNCPSYHGDNLGTTAKARTKLGDVFVRVKIGDKTTDKSLEVYQQANEETLGTLAVKSFSYSPKVGAAEGTASPTVTYELPYSWTSGASGKYTTDASLSYSTVTDNAGATLDASTGVVIWAANSGNERSETERVTVSLKGKINTAEAVSTQSGDAVDHYDAPTGLSISCNDIPASGGTISEGTVSGTATQVVHYKSGAMSTIDVSVSESWSTAVSASNLQKTVKSRTKVGTLTLTYSANNESNTASCDVYQAKNERHTGTTYTKDHTMTGDISYGEERKYYGDITYGEKKHGGEYLKDTSYGEKVQDADTFGEWETTGTSTYKYNYAVSFASTSWSPGALSSNIANAITASHLEKPQYDQRRKITHNYHTPYTQHYYKDWTRTNSRSYTCSASQNCNYIEYRTDTFDSGATEYVEENKSHTETWTASGTESNYSTDRGSDWSRDASGSTPSTSDGGYEYGKTYGDNVTPKTDSPSVSSDATWLSWSSGTMYVTENKGSSRSAYLRASNGDASVTCYVTQAGATITYKLTCTGSPISITVGDSKSFSGTVEYLKYINGNYDSKQNVTLSASFSTGSSSVATITSLSYLNSVKGVAAGTTKIYATYNGISSKDNNDSGIDVTVKEPDVITYKLVCTGSEVSMTVGETVSYTPVVTYKKYVNGNYDSEETVTKSASFSTGDNSIATVSTSGSGNFRTYMSTGVAAGTTKIYATYKGISSKDNGDSGISVTVTRKVTYSISVNPTSLTFAHDASGSGSQKTATVTCPEGDWEVVSPTPSGWTATKSGNTVVIYPNAANTGTEEKKGTVTVRCKGDTSKTADITVTQGKNTEKYDVDVD